MTNTNSNSKKLLPPKHQRSGRFISPSISVLVLSLMVHLGMLAVLPSALAQSQPQSADKVVQTPESTSPSDSTPEQAKEQSAPAAASQVNRFNWSKAGFTSFINPRQRLAEPDQELLDKGLRLITADDFAPFNWRAEDGNPRGYHIELARAICEELNLACTIKFVPFGDIPDMLAKGTADAAIAGLAIRPDLAAKIGYSVPYLKRAARFVKKRSNPLQLDGTGLADKPVAVRGGSAHEAFLKAYFPSVRRIPVTGLNSARQLLEDDKVAAIFGDGLQLLPILTADESDIELVGRPYYDSHFFGEGMTIAFQKQQAGLKNLFDFALLKLTQKGRLAELYVRHFALDVYASN